MAVDFELDHLFVCTAAGAPEGEILTKLGLVEGEPNIHPGQGTANRRFFFQNAMLELLWVRDPVEAKSELTRPTHLWERWLGRNRAASPFGFCFRPKNGDSLAAPFPSWQYRPHYLEAPLSLSIGDNAAILEEPMLVFMPFGRRPEGLGKPVRHPLGINELTAIKLFSPCSTSQSGAWQKVIDARAIQCSTGPEHLVELGFDGGTAGKRADLRPGLPVILVW